MMSFPPAPPDWDEEKFGPWLYSTELSELLRDKFSLKQQIDRFKSLCNSPSTGVDTWELELLSLLHDAQLMIEEFAPKNEKLWSTVRSQLSSIILKTQAYTTATDVPPPSARKK